MASNSTQESRRLLGSVKDKYNGPEELDIRKGELKNGIREAEQAFAGKFPVSSRLLDIGCATGRLCFALARQGYDVTGIDVAEKQIEQARRTAKAERVDVTFLQYEMPLLPFADASFAAAFMGNVYCYVPHRASRIAFLEEIARVLYSHGEVFLSQTVLDSVLEGYEDICDDNHRRYAPEYETLEEGDGFVLGAPHYLHFFFAEDLMAELEAFPFQVVSSDLKKSDFKCVLRKRNT
ncbi:MAG: class I SAM-dependent methyltransferase [Gemmatimonadota bacterium]|nr:class I SAM-dependent methyltransferase [Gemmatimonadota bacterium]MDE2846032.1 class I SAM-dependent methyltransferase [Gemmatimonadota bacterium]